MKFHTEFPDYPATEMPGVPEGYGFVETSWHNDMCPSFTSDEIGMTLWIDYPHADDREFPDSKRFVIQSQDHGVETGEFSLNTDDWNEVLAFIASRKG